MSLLNAIENRKSMRHQGAIKRYATILESGDESNADELMELMELLGKSQSDVASDLQALKGWHGSNERYQAAAALYEKMKEARTELEKMAEDLAVFKAKGGYDSARDTELERAHLRFNQAENAWRVALKAGDHGDEIRRKNPDLFINKAA